MVTHHWMHQTLLQYKNSLKTLIFFIVLRTDFYRLEYLQKGVDGASRNLFCKVIIKTSRRSLNQQWLHTLHKFAEPLGLYRVTIPAIYFSD